MTYLATSLKLAKFSVTERMAGLAGVRILDFIGAKDDGGGGDKYRYKTYKAPVNLLLTLSGAKLQ